MSRPSTLQNHRPLPYAEEHATSLSDARLRGIVAIWQEPGLERTDLHLSVMKLAERGVEALTSEVRVWPEAHERAQREAERWARLRHVGLCLLHMPWLDRLFCMGSLSWEQVDLLSCVISPPHETAWIDQALALDLRALTALVARSARGGPPNTEGAPVARPRRLGRAGGEEGEEGTSLALARRRPVPGSDMDVRHALVRRRFEALDVSARKGGTRGAPGRAFDRPTSRRRPTEGEGSASGAAWIDAHGRWVRRSHATRASVSAARRRDVASSHARTRTPRLRSAPNVRRRRIVRLSTA